MSEDTPDIGRLREVFSALDRHRVQYAVFGAVALGMHGLPRSTADLDLFLAPAPENVERLKAALREVYDDPSVDEISVEEMCGDYPAVRYMPPTGFGLDIVTRLGEAVAFADLEIEPQSLEGVPVSVVTARTLWRLKKDTVRPRDRFDAQALAERFRFEES